MAAHDQISPLIGIPLALRFLACWPGFLVLAASLLHGDKSRSEPRSLIHHFLIYGPGQPMRLKIPRRYRAALSVGNVGLEWLVPSAMILAGLWATMRLVPVPALYQRIALATLVLWPLFMFSYLHDRMHLSDFWMARNSVLRFWFRAARRMHDIHHHAVDDNGRMEANFGIGFFLFDRIFLTIGSRHRPFNRTGFEAARLRYGLIEQGGKLIPNNKDRISAKLSLRPR
jgi:hypothetical protein